MEHIDFKTQCNQQPDTILVVDDNATILEIMAAILRGKGYHVLFAESGQQAVSSSELFVPDLILLDIDMPEMSGLEVCRFLKQQHHTRHIPIIFVTAMTDNDTLREAFECGGTDYVRKPVNSVELLSRIKSVLASEKLKKRLVEKEKLAGVLEMAGAVCHELNQPLQAMQLYLDIFNSKTLNMEDLPRQIENLHQQIERISEICRKIMRISKYECTDYVDGIKIIDIDKASGKS